MHELSLVFACLNSKEKVSGAGLELSIIISQLTLHEILDECTNDEPLPQE